MKAMNFNNNAYVVEPEEVIPSVKKGLFLYCSNGILKNLDKKCKTAFDFEDLVLEFRKGL
jgi:hypothetical protein